MKNIVEMKENLKSNTNYNMNYDSMGGEDSSNFFYMPYELKNYVFLKDYKVEMNYLFALIDNWCEQNHGDFAPISQSVLARYYGKSTATLRKHLEVMERYGLIMIVSARKGVSNIYIPKQPLTSKELFAKYPAAITVEYERLLWNNTK